MKKWLKTVFLDIFEDQTFFEVKANRAKGQIPYYAFGMEMTGRSVGSDYKYGMNGQEKCDEVYGTGNYLDFKYRGYDPRLGRFISKDLMANYLPWVTPYSYAENRPIDGIDFEGNEHQQFNYHFNREGKITSIDDLSDMIKQVGKKGWGIQLNFYILDDEGEKLIKRSFIPTKAPFIWTGSSRPLYIFGMKTLDETTPLNTPSPVHSNETGFSQTITAPVSKTDIKAYIYDNGSSSLDYKASFEQSFNTKLENWGDKVSVGTNIKLYSKFNFEPQHDFDPTIGIQIPINAYMYIKGTVRISRDEESMIKFTFASFEIGGQLNTSGNKPATEINLKWLKADLKKQTFGFNPILGLQKDDKNSSNNSSESHQNVRDLD